MKEVDVKLRSLRNILGVGFREFVFSIVLLKVLKGRLKLMEQ